MSDLHVLLAKEGIEEISSESFRESAHLQMENLKVIYHLLTSSNQIFKL